MDYFELRSADAQQKLLNETVEQYADMVKLTMALLNGGAVPESDLVQAKTQLDTARVQDTIEFTRDGALWVGSDDGLFRFDHGPASVSILSGVPISQIEESSDGHLFMKAAQEFVEWDGVRIVDHPRPPARLGVSDDGFFRVIRDHNRLMFCTGEGAVHMAGHSVRCYPHPKAGAPLGRHVHAHRGPARQSMGAHDDGLFRRTAGGLEPLLTGVAVRSLFAGRDGNLWVGTNLNGLVRFRDQSVRMFTTADGLPNNIPMTVLARHDGSIWVGNNCGGLSWFDGRRFRTYDEKHRLSSSCVWALAEDNNDDLWIGT